MPAKKREEWKSPLGQTVRKPRRPGPGLDGTEIMSTGTRRSVGNDIEKGDREGLGEIDYILRMMEINRRLRNPKKGSYRTQLKGLFGGK